MGICNSSDIFQEKISELFDRFDIGIQDKFPVTAYFPSIVLYGITIRNSTIEYFPIR